jgi:hypothetical protein
MHGAAGLRAREAVVVAEGDALLAEVVNTVEDEPASPRGKRWGSIARKEEFRAEWSEEEPRVIAAWI